MIKLHDQVPSIYSKASRDFQYLGWLINIVLNSVKHNVDDMYALPNAMANPKITELLAMTLGFKVKRNYDQKQLIALVTILPTILKYKGTIKSIEMAAEALLTASGSLNATDVTVSAGTNVIVTLPEDLVDTTLFIDLLDYILPAGMTCHIVRKAEAKSNLVTKLRYVDTAHFEVCNDLDWNDGTSTGLSGLYDLDQSTHDFTANFKNNDVNAGLLTNTVIPTLPDAELIPDIEAPEDTVVLYSSDNKLLYTQDNKVLRAIKSDQ